MIALDERKSDDHPDDLKKIGNLALELGVEINENAKDQAPAAVAMWLFDGSVENLPGGYDEGELSPNSPVKELKSFPQDLVLVGRSCILIKGLSSRLEIPWSLAKEWAPVARGVLYRTNTKRENATNARVRFRDVLTTVKLWGKGKIMSGVKKLPPSVRNKLAGIILRGQERRDLKKN